jgi:hypothetical protein
MTEAVLKSFDNIFDGSWSGVKIHIEPSAYVPDDLKRAGKSEAEVLDREALIEKFKSSEQAPAMAVVNAFKANGGLVHVQIEYFPVRTKDWHEATIERGMYEFVYRRTKDRLVMLRRTKSTF